MASAARCQTSTLDGNPTAGTTVSESQPKKSPAMAAVAVRHVRPGLMAYWLDPENQDVPIELLTDEKGNPRLTIRVTNGKDSEAATAGEKLSPGAKSTRQAHVPLKGIDRVIAIDSQKVILVYGTTEGLKELQTLVSYLDRPEHLSGLTSRYVEAKPEAGKDFNTDSPTPGPVNVPSNDASTSAGLPDTKASSSTPATKLQPEGSRIMKAISVQNVRPAMMAYWLDPENQAKPIELLNDEKIWSRSLGQAGLWQNPYVPKSGPAKSDGTSVKQRGFALPESVDRIVAVDSQNVLLVFGTKKGITEVESLVSYLDRPIQLVEMTVQYVEVEDRNLKELTEAIGLDFNSSSGPFTTRSRGLSSGDGTFTLGFVRKDIKTALDSFLKRGVARRLGLSQTVVPNNMATTASLLTSSSGKTGNTYPQRVDIDTVITPTINADGTLTVLMAPRLKSGAFERGSVEQSVNTVANVRDGDTIALGGLRSGERELLIFLTAKVMPAATKK